MIIFYTYFLDFDSHDLSSSSVLDGEYITMLSSSEKLMSGDYDALERLQAELELFNNNPNQPEEVAEQITVETHTIDEEVSGATITPIKKKPIENIKDEIEESGNEYDPDNIIQIKSEPKVEQQENVVLTVKTTQPQYPEIISVGSSGATKRSAPSSIQGNPQSKKSV